MKSRSPVVWTSILLAGSLLAAEVHAGTCRIDWHPRARGLFAVIKDGQPYKNKAYIAHDDVVRLREVLVASGDCSRDLAQEMCSVRQTTAGRFQIHFGPRPLYSDESHGNQGVASRQVQDLVKVGFCRAKPQLPRQTTASAKSRKLKITSE